MKNFKETKRLINSACNVVNLQSERLSASIPDSELKISLCSDAESESDISKKCSPSQYNFEQDVATLIKVSKEFQTDYENEKGKNVNEDAIDNPDNDLRIPILSSNSFEKQKNDIAGVKLNDDDDDFYFSTCSFKKENIVPLSQRIKKHTPKIPLPGPFGTGISRPTPKKHSCIVKTELKPPIKRTFRSGWNVRPYTGRYYNFDQTHPQLKLVENGSMIPKRISKDEPELTEVSISTKHLLNRELTWREFFERSNVSFRSSNVPTHTMSTQTNLPDSLTSKSNEVNKIEVHSLPQLNIRAECCVQRIPKVSIAPCELKSIVNSNIKLVEIVYEESQIQVRTSESEESQSNPLTYSESSVNLRSLEVNESPKVSESATHSSKTSSVNSGCDSSLENSVSLSRLSTVTTPLDDHEGIEFVRRLKDVSVQTSIQQLETREQQSIDRKNIQSSHGNQEVECNDQENGKSLFLYLKLNLQFRIVFLQ